MIMGGHALVTVEGGATSSLLRKLTNFLHDKQGKQTEMIGKIEIAKQQLEKIEVLLLKSTGEKAEDDPVKSIMQKKNLDRQKVMIRLRELSFGMEDNVDELILWTGRRASKGINDHETNIQRSCEDIKALHDILTENMRGIFREEGWMFHQLMVMGSELHQSLQSTASDLQRGRLDVSPSLVPGSIPELENGTTYLANSYCNLPSNLEGVDLKACALCFSILPSKHTIDRDWLVRIWISEGLVPAEAAAEVYLDELVKQNIIQQVECCNSIEVKTYQVQCMMLYLLQSISELENFVTLLCPSNSNDSSDRSKKHVCRLSVHGSDSTICETIMNLKGVQQKRSHIRSLTVFGGDIKQIPFEEFVSLRVLELEGCVGIVTGKMVEYICKMQLLKYLGLKATQLSELPSQIKDLTQLETLDIRNTQVRKLPMEVNQLEKLLHLLIGDSHAHRGLKLPVGISKKLRLLKVLCSIDLREHEPEVLQELGDLQELKELEIVLPYDGPADVKRNDELLSSLGKCNKLQSLVVHGDFICSIDGPASYKRKDPGLKKLRLTTSIFNDLSAWIKKLVFLDLLDIRVSTLEDNDLKILQELPELQSLALRLEALPRREVGNGEEEPVPIRITEGFLRLKKFSFDCLMPWICFEEKAMLMLEHLEFKFTGGPLPSKNTSTSWGHASANWEFGIKHLTSLGKVALWCSRYNTNVEETIKLMEIETNSHKNEIILVTKCYPTEMQMPQPQINVGHAESSSVAAPEGNSAIGTPKDIVQQTGDQGCNAEFPCDICEQEGHTALKCPLLKSPKPAAKMCGHGVKGLGFHQIQGSENKLGVVHVSQGSSAADLEKELRRLVQIKWQWNVKENEKMKNSFIVNFPSRAELLKFTKNTKFAINATGVVEKVVEWFPSTTKRQLMTVWVKVRGVPSDARDYLSLWEVGSLVGSTVDVDMTSAKSQETVRIQVALLKPDLFPCSMEVAVGTWLYTFYFDVEQRDENNKGVHLDYKGGSDPEQDPNQFGSEYRVNAVVSDCTEGRPEATTPEIMKDKRQVEDQQVILDSDDKVTHDSYQKQSDKASAENCEDVIPTGVGRPKQDISQEIGHAASSEQADNIISKPRGLRNLGNTCHFNAVLQSLLALDSLRSKIISFDDPTKELVTSLKELFQETEYAGHPLSPEKLVNYMKITKNKMEDSHETLGNFRKGLRQEVSAIVDSIFVGQESRVVSSTQCSHFSDGEEEFLDLLLPIPENSGSVGLKVEDCLRLYFKSELLSGENSWNCDKCPIADSSQEITASCKKEIIDDIIVTDELSIIADAEMHRMCPNRSYVGAAKTSDFNSSDTAPTEKRVAKKKHFIRMAPLVLTILLIRFHDKSTKDERHVGFDDELDIQPFMDPRGFPPEDVKCIFNENKNTAYRLVAVVEHQGSTMDKGHYVAYVRYDGSWCCANDERISDLKREAPHCEAYILFYERCDVNAPGNQKDILQQKNSARSEEPDDAEELENTSETQLSDKPTDKALDEHKKMMEQEASKR